MPSSADAALMFNLNFIYGFYADTNSGMPSLTISPPSSNLINLKQMIMVQGTKGRLLLVFGHTATEGLVRAPE